MYIKNIVLINYRNYENLVLNLSEGVNIFNGDNAQGKTNILEAIYYCAFAKSHRTTKERELIQWNKDKAYISIMVSKKRLDKKIDINILRTGKKAVKVNSLPISKISELFGIFNVVMFSPEDLKIIKESPGLRRRLLDMELCQINKSYYFNLVQYNKILNERNTVLKKNTLDQDILDVYDLQLIKYGDYIIKERLKYINKVNYYGKDIHSDITNGKEEISIKYVSTSGIQDINQDSKLFLEKLRLNRTKDFERGLTLIGPHRDDFNIDINGKDIKIFGSQGQQRTAVLTLKFSSLKIIKENTGEYPVLLLDDVLSELDDNRKKYVLKSINHIQTIITCTGMSDLQKYVGDNCKIFDVSHGEILNN